jgi:hypothetical protein
MKSSELKVGDRVVYRNGGNPEFLGGQVTEVSPTGEFVCFDHDTFVVWRRVEQVTVVEALEAKANKRSILFGTNGTNGKAKNVNAGPATPAAPAP